MTGLKADIETAATRCETCPACGREKIFESATRLGAHSRYGGCVLWVFGSRVWGTPPGQTGGVYRIWAWRLAWFVPVPITPELAIGFIDGLKQSVETGRILNRP
jgi:hypothetical protein